jgi:histidine phosphotransferase ChpT
MSPDARLARTLCARLCHDLGGMVATLAGMLDLVEGEGSEMLALSRETATTLRQRLRLYAAAWGSPGEGLDAAALGTLLEGSPARPRVGFALDELASGTSLPGAVVPLALNAAMLGAEALPRGGVLHLGGNAEEGLVVWPEGRDAAWPAPLPELLSGTAPAEALEGGGPRRVLAPLLLTLAADAGWEVSLGLGGGAGAAPLLLTPVRA